MHTKLYWGFHRKKNELNWSIYIENNLELLTSNFKWKLDRKFFDFDLFSDFVHYWNQLKEDF